MSAALLCAALITAPTVAIDANVAEVEIGASVAEVERAISQSQLQAIEWRQRGEAGALASTLVDSGLLQALNEEGLTPHTAQGRLDTRRLTRFVSARSADRRFVLAFDDGGRLAFALVRITIVVDRAADPEGHSGSGRARLDPLRGAVQLGARGLEPAERDERGNIFAWKAAGRTLRYRPADDELRLVISRGAVQLR